MNGKRKLIFDSAGKDCEEYSEEMTDCGKVYAYYVVPYYNNGGTAVKGLKRSQEKRCAAKPRIFPTIGGILIFKIINKKRLVKRAVFLSEFVFFYICHSLFDQALHVERLFHFRHFFQIRPYDGKSRQKDGAAIFIRQYGSVICVYLP